MKIKFKKGFTLVEIISIVAVLGAIAVLVLPKISSNNSEKKQKQYDNTVTAIENAGKAYYSINPNSCHVSLDTLVDENYLTSGLTNPLTESTFSGCVNYTINGDMASDYQYESDASVCTSTANASVFSLTINPNGGVYEETTSNTVITPVCTNNIIPITETPTYVGRTFAGWSVTGGGSINNGIIPILTMGNSNTTITASWTTDAYTISYNLNGGIVETPNPTGYNVSTSTITLNNPARPGYRFDGWTGSNGTTPQTEVTIPVGSTGNKTYTANWTIIPYTISYNLNGGIVQTPNPTGYNVNTSTITLNNPTKLGYIFTGWTGSNSTVPQTEVTIPKGSTENKTYTANWGSIFTYTLSNGGTAIAGTHYEFIADTARCASCWRIKFYASGTFTPLTAMTIDTFLVGGGGGSGGGYFACGGGGGYTKTYTGKGLTAGTGYTVVIGAGGAGKATGSKGATGGSTSGFGYAAVLGGEGGDGANGGEGWTVVGGGDGGSGGGGGGYTNYGTPVGGAGGSYGGDGGRSCSWASDGQSCSGIRRGGAGQGNQVATNNTCEFGEGTLTGCTRGTDFAYAGGGAGMGNTAGGVGGGGQGHSGSTLSAGTDGRGGGGGGSYSGTRGGSGIVVIRNHI